VTKRTITAATREAWRAAALRNRPWTNATGPRTDAGKRRAAANGKRRQRGPSSTRELLAVARALRAEHQALLAGLPGGGRLPNGQAGRRRPAAEGAAAPADRAGRVTRSELNAARPGDRGGDSSIQTEGRPKNSGDSTTPSSASPAP
jgi:hypothetical protein